jgi:branched-chain amino acid transport system substrate-binding protein
MALGACSGSSLGDDATDSGGKLRIGLIVPLSGPYKSAGDDQRAGWKLALETLGGKLGGHPVEVVEADEGDGKATAFAAAKKLIERDEVVALVGGATADTVNTVYPLLEQARIPLIGIGGRPSTVKDATWLWSTSWLSQETGAAIADHIRTTVKGPVWAIGPDYIGGKDQIGGFVTKYTAGGGKLANPGGVPTWTPWAPQPTTDFQPYLTAIKNSNAAAVYAFYGGTSAIEFVKQYRQFGVDKPLYASGFLTEGAPLDALGQQAKDIYTCLNYSPTLDNEANRQFVQKFTAAHNGKLPNLLHVAAWDAALVLDKAIIEARTQPTAATPTPAPSGSPSPSPAVAGSALPTIGGVVSGGVSSLALTAALPRIGQVDSPRGGWQFGPLNHTPVQKYYLRQVLFDGQAYVNVTLQELATLGS